MGPLPKKEMEKQEGVRIGGKERKAMQEERMGGVRSMKVNEKKNSSLTQSASGRIIILLYPRS